MKRIEALVIACSLLTACGSDRSDPTVTVAEEAPVVRQYAVNLDANYQDVIAHLEALQVQTSDFLAGPSDSGLAAVRQAWLDARPAYGESEVSRFYGGPMDEAQGAMNEWPIDENFIDYTADEPMAGLINDPQAYPDISADTLRAADERGGIENLSTGFHAIEFLLWGQRPDQTSGPGERPFTDYVDGGTASNQARRRAYLQTSVDILLSDMLALDAEWDLSNPQSYGAQLVAGPAHDAIGKIVRGFTSLGISELYYERLVDPFVTRDRKDEESCFSENTLADLQANAQGVENVYLGRYGDAQGPSLSELVRAKSPALDRQLKAQLSAARSAIDAIPAPFDHAVIAPTDSEQNLLVRAAIDTFLPLRDSFREMAALLDVTINL